MRMPCPTLTSSTSNRCPSRGRRTSASSRHPSLSRRSSASTCGFPSSRFFRVSRICSQRPHAASAVPITPVMAPISATIFVALSPIHSIPLLHIESPMQPSMVEGARRTDNFPNALPRRGRQFRRFHRPFSLSFAARPPP